MRPTDSRDMTGESFCKKEAKPNSLKQHEIQKHGRGSDTTQPKYNKETKPKNGETSNKAKRTKSLSIELTGEMHKTLKTVALNQDDTLNSLVIEALKQFLEKEEKLNAKAEKLRKRLS